MGVPRDSLVIKSDLWASTKRFMEEEKIHSISYIGIYISTAALSFIYNAPSALYVGLLLKTVPKLQLMENASVRILLGTRGMDHNPLILCSCRR